MITSVSSDLINSGLTYVYTDDIQGRIVPAEWTAAVAAVANGLINTAQQWAGFYDRARGAALVAEAWTNGDEVRRFAQVVVEQTIAGKAAPRADQMPALMEGINQRRAERALAAIANAPVPGPAQNADDAAEAVDDVGVKTDQMTATYQ